MDLVSEHLLLGRRRIAVAVVVVGAVGKWSDLFLSTYPQPMIPNLAVKAIPGRTYKVAGC
jgi:hypothetical protein